MAGIAPIGADQPLDEVRGLITAYAAWLNVDFCLGSIERELALFPGEYGPPCGVFLLAEQDGRAAGCVGLRRIADGVCEMKRLFVRPAFRGLGIGRALAEAIIDAARSMGYHTMRLDTIEDRMPEAVNLYRSFGFKNIPAYNEHPVQCTAWMELDLRCVPGRVAERQTLGT